MITPYEFHTDSFSDFLRDENGLVAGVGGVLDLLLAVPDPRRPPRPPHHVVGQFRLGRLRRLRLSAVGAGHGLRHHRQHRRLDSHLWFHGGRQEPLSQRCGTGRHGT